VDIIIAIIVIFNNAAYPCLSYE